MHVLDLHCYVYKEKVHVFGQESYSLASCSGLLMLSGCRATWVHLRTGTWGGCSVFTFITKIRPESCSICTQNDVLYPDWSKQMQSWVCIGNVICDEVSPPYFSKNVLILLIRTVWNTKKKKRRTDLRWILVPKFEIELTSVLIQIVPNKIMGSTV